MPCVCACVHCVGSPAGGADASDVTGWRTMLEAFLSACCSTVIRDFSEIRSQGFCGLHM